MHNYFRGHLVLIKQISKFFGFCGLVLTFTFGATGIIFFTPQLYTQRRRLAHWIRMHTKTALRLLEIKVNLISNKWPKETLLTQQNYLVVSNHLSYLDILAISSLLPCGFVTSVEVRNTPFLGWLARLGGCLFVERRSRGNLLNEIADISLSLQNQLNVCIFPEATSTNGEAVLRFRRPLYQSAIQSGRPVVPLTLNYTGINDQQIGVHNRDIVFWYGDMPFLSHLWRVMAQNKIELQIHLDQPMNSQDHSLESLVDTSHQIVTSAYRPITV